MIPKSIEWGFDYVHNPDRVRVCRGNQDSYEVLTVEEVVHIIEELQESLVEHADVKIESTGDAKINARIASLSGLDDADYCSDEKAMTKAEFTLNRKDFITYWRILYSRASGIPIYMVPPKAGDINSLDVTCKDRALAFISTFKGAIEAEAFRQRFCNARDHIMGVIDEHIKHQ